MNCSKYMSHSLAELQLIAQQLADQLRGTDRLGLTGPLGAGKTTFLKYLGQALGIIVPIESPTFILRQAYLVPIHPTIRNFVHVDLYRVDRLRDLNELGLQDDWLRTDTLIAIEWIDRAPELASRITHRLEFDYGDGLNDRSLKLSQDK